MMIITFKTQNPKIICRMGTVRPEKINDVWFLCLEPVIVDRSETNR